MSYLTVGCLTIICIQFGIIIGFVVHTSRQDQQIEAWRIEAMDWEHISEAHKRSAATWAMQSEKCLLVVRDYQRSVFQPKEMGK